MQENRISIIIDRPIQEVFEYTTNPKNTHKWIEHLVEEKTNEFPPKLGTMYTNTDGSGFWDEYFVEEFEDNKIFTLSSKDEKYHVRYTYTLIGENKTKMEYYEWMTEGELSNPFKVDILEILKKKLEE